MVQDAMATGYIELPNGSLLPKPSRKIHAAVAKTMGARPKKLTPAKTKPKAGRGSASHESSRLAIQRIMEE